MAEKAYLNGGNIFLQVSDADMQAQVQEALWTSTWGRETGQFMPHECWSSESRQEACISPLLIGVTEPPPSHYDLLINLSDDVPLYFSRFERVLEIIDATQPEAGRLRYQFYQNRGYPLQTHKIPAN